MGHADQQSHRAGTKRNLTAPVEFAIVSQQSGWLSLAAGQQYYIEILHKAGVGTNDNWSVGWLQDPTGTNNTPAGVVPGYLLSRYYPPLPANTPGTLYSANLLALPGVVSEGVGSATLRVNAAGTQATLNFTITNLVGTPTGKSINSDPYLNDPGELIFDISAAKPQAERQLSVEHQGDRPAGGRGHFGNHQRRQGRHRHRKHGLCGRRNRRPFHAGQRLADLHAAARAARLDG